METTHQLRMAIRHHHHLNRRTHPLQMENTPATSTRDRPTRPPEPPSLTTPASSARTVAAPGSTPSADLSVRAASASHGETAASPRSDSARGSSTVSVRSASSSSGDASPAGLAVVVGLWEDAARVGLGRFSSVDWRKACGSHTNETKHGREKTYQPFLNVWM
mmetsp:Transcript_53694/g.62736  ORF Transcript_53694/g.62736 Transcript_53694/m.62736 type:complete len:163 (+) Transcript_53694:682-1170(+)